nr:hypothetical protein [Chloracidobacterium thermophilum]
MQPEISRGIHNARLSGKCVNVRHGFTVGQGQKDNFRAAGFGQRSKHQPGSRQMRMNGVQRFPSRFPPGDGDDRHLRMRQQQAEEFSTNVTGGADDGDAPPRRRCG